MRSKSKFVVAFLALTVLPSAGLTYKPFGTPARDTAAGFDSILETTIVSGRAPAECPDAGSVLPLP